ncbi:MAG: hypothetical protein CM15mP18_1860 [Methanobacteriota archaeon]|nr:MAG: hypothetical protein CM15mP18_1860 [Euryarchaeota archaeon]
MDEPTVLTLRFFPDGPNRHRASLLPLPKGWYAGLKRRHDRQKCLGPPKPQGRPWRPRVWGPCLRRKNPKGLNPGLRGSGFSIPPRGPGRPPGRPLAALVGRRFWSSFFHPGPNGWSQHRFIPQNATKSPHGRRKTPSVVPFPGPHPRAKSRNAGVRTRVQADFARASRRGPVGPFPKRPQPRKGWARPRGPRDPSLHPGTPQKPAATTCWWSRGGPF